VACVALHHKTSTAVSDAGDIPDGQRLAEFPCARPGL
jgi:hypothetical protein